MIFSNRKTLRWCVFLVTVLLVGAIIGGMVSWICLDSSPRTEGMVVAASDSPPKMKNSADYVCDGINDEVEIMAAVNRLREEGGGIIKLLEGTYILGAQISVNYEPHTINVPVHIMGCGAATVIDASSVVRNPQGFAFCIYGATIEKKSTGLVVDALEGQRTIVVADALAFAEGDYIKIQSDAKLGFNQRGEMQHITGIAGNKITLEEALADNYRTGDNAKIVYHVIAREITVSDLKIVGNRNNESLVGIYAVYAANVHLNRIYIQDIVNKGILLTHVMHSEVSNCYFSGVSRMGLGYCIAVTGASRNINITNNIASDSRKLVLASGGPDVGISRFINVIGNSVSGTAIFDSHGEGEHMLVADNVANYRQGSLIMVGIDDVLIKDNLIYNHTGDGTTNNPAIAIDGSEMKHCEVIGNRIFWNPASPPGMEKAIDFGPDCPNLETVVVTDNYIDGYKYPIGIASSLNGVIIKDNVIRNPVSGGYGIQFNNAKIPSTGLNISDNDVDGNGKMLAGVNIEAKTNPASVLSNIRISGNTISNCTDFAVVIDAGNDKNHSIRDVQISGNYLGDSQKTPTQDYGIKLSGNIDGVLIWGNMFRGNTAGTVGRMGWAGDGTNSNIKIYDNLE